MPHDSAEQLMIELINRARMDPGAEAARQGLALNDGLAPGTIGTAPLQVLAPSALLLAAADAHSAWQLATDTFNHIGDKGSKPGDRIAAAGYAFTGSWGWGENIAYWSHPHGVEAVASILNHHDGLYASPSHRKVTFGASYRELGIGQQLGSFQGVPASIVTQNFAYSGTAVFLTGVAIRDADGDLFYDVGEGRGGITLASAAGSTATAAAGGYALAHAGAGPLAVTVTAGGQTSRLEIRFDAGNVKLDVLLGAGGEALRFLTTGGVTLQGGAVRDIALLGVADAALTGSAGDDTLTGNAGHNRLTGGDGHDILDGGAGNDVIFGGTGDDLLRAASGRNQMWAGTGNDTVIGGISDDILGGGSGDDLIDARAGGQNQLWGGDGRDTLWASDMGDMAGGGWGDDIVHGGSGADTLFGGLGNDTVNGYGGNDTLYLSIGNDMGHGGAGDDTIFAGPGFDQLWGGAGADRFEFWRGAGWNRVEDFSAAEGDTLALGRWMWTGTHGSLTAAQVVQTFGRVTAQGDAVLDFAGAGTTVVVVGLGSLDGLADSLLIL